MFGGYLTNLSVYGIMVALRNEGGKALTMRPLPTFDIVYWSAASGTSRTARLRTVKHTEWDHFSWLLVAWEENDEDWTQWIPSTSIIEVWSFGRRLWRSSCPPKAKQVVLSTHLRFTR